MAILANVVDDAELSGFIVPAIVDRSPLVIAVSSGGTAPVLARLVRERIEVLVDESVGALASLLERWRSRIKAAFPDVAVRRRFYETAVRGAAALAMRRGRRVTTPSSGSRANLARPVAAGTGSVAIVGAGPGDPGLLTLNALRALQSADVILHDRLVSPEVLALARRDADCIEVGKQAGGQSVTQQRHPRADARARKGRTPRRPPQGRRSVRVRPRRRGTRVPRGARNPVRGRSRRSRRQSPAAHMPASRSRTASTRSRCSSSPRTVPIRFRRVTGTRSPRGADAVLLHGRGRTRSRWARS